MSNEAINWSWRHEGLSTSEGAVLFVLADAADPTDLTCYPGQETIAHRARITVRQVQRAVKRLEELGLITRSRRSRHDGSRTSDMYTVNLDVVHVESEPVEADTYPTQCRVDGSEPTRHHVAANPTPCRDLPDTMSGPKKNHQVNHQENPQTTRDKRASNTTAEASFNVFWDAYPKKVGKLAAKKAWTKALKANDPDALIAAAHRYTEQRHGQDPQFTAHPATWLNQGRWDDETPAPTPTTPSGARGIDYSVLRALDERLAGHQQPRHVGELKAVTR